MVEIMTLDRAVELATLAHAGVKDKGGGDYIEHPLRVMDGVEGLPAKMVAALHDVVEDTDWRKAAGVLSEDDDQLNEAERIAGWVALLLREGCPGEVLAAVLAISRGERENVEAYYARVAANPLALEVKYADIADNANPYRLSLLDEATRVRLTKKYAKARRILGELSGPAGRGQTL